MLYTFKINPSIALYIPFLFPGYVEYILNEYQNCGNMGLYGVYLDVYYKRNLFYSSFIISSFSFLFNFYLFGTFYFFISLYLFCKTLHKWSWLF